MIVIYIKSKCNKNTHISNCVNYGDCRILFIDVQFLEEVWRGVGLEIGDRKIQKGEVCNGIWQVVISRSIMIGGLNQGI